MRQSFKVSFYLRSNYENKEGKSPVMLRIFLGGAMSNLGSTKIFVDKAQWNNRTSRQKGRSSEALAVNASLDAISANLHSLYHKYQDDQTISLDKLRSAYYDSVAQGFSHLEAEAIASEVLYQGLHFSKYDTLVSILEQEFSEELPEPLPHRLAPILLGNKSIQAVFSKYDLRDDFDGYREYELLYTELTGTIILLIEENHLPIVDKAEIYVQE